MPKLETVSPQLETLIVPQDLQADVNALKEANSQLRGAWSGFVGYLDDPDLTYEAPKAQRHLQQIARAWYDFKKAHAAANKTIGAKLK